MYIAWFLASTGRGTSIVEMDHFKQIYSTRAAAYHKMIQAEDVDGNLLPAIARRVALAGKRVLDLGSGSGRLSLPLCRRRRPQPCFFLWLRNGGAHSPPGMGARAGMDRRLDQKGQKRGTTSSVTTIMTIARGKPTRG